MVGPLPRIAYIERGVGPDLNPELLRALSIEDDHRYIERGGALSPLISLVASITPLDRRNWPSLYFLYLYAVELSYPDIEGGSPFCL